MDNLDYCLQYKKPLVLATTGFSQEQTVKIHDAAKVIPLVFSPNMSIGVNLLFGVVGEIARKLGIDDGFKIAVNNGRIAGQIVFHLHIHILGGWKRSPEWEI